MHVAAMALVQRIEAPPPGATRENVTVVARLFRDLPYRAALTHRAEFENGTITLTMPLSLAPGRYRVETVMLDVEASAASTRTFSLVVSPPATQTHAMDVSDLVWVHSLRPRDPSDGDNPADSLDAPAGKITPELSATFRLTATPGFFFRVCDSTGQMATPDARIAIVRDGSTVRTMDIHLPAAQPDGCNSFLGQLPITDLTAGAYDVQLFVRSKEGQVSRLSRLVLQN